MGRIFDRKKKTEDRKAVEFCEGVRLLNDPEITDGGREGADYRKESCAEENRTAEVLLQNACWRYLS